MNQHEPRRTDPPPEAEGPSRITPMMEQYIEIRAANPDCLLFYRMGDFYELFFGDAETAAQALGIALTKRGKHFGEDIPMCGVPVHAADAYLQKLIALGHRVAVCEQIEDPAEARRRGGKSVVRRAVTRLVTPGTITEDALLDSGRNNFLAAVVKIVASQGADRHALAWIDISTGEFRIGECPAGGLAALASRVEPREVIVADKHSQDSEITGAVRLLGAALTPVPAAFFDAGSAEERLCGLYSVKTMESFGAFSRAELVAGAALVAYAEKTQVSRRPPLEPPKRVSPDEFMRLDAATRGNLELFRTVAGAARGSLLHAIDRTRTAGGSRLLAARLGSPLCDAEAIEDRLDCIQFLIEEQALRAAVRAALAAAPDMLRAFSRLGLERGGPRDLDCFRAGLEAAQAIAERLSASDRALPAPVAAPCRALAGARPDLAHAIRAVLADDLPLLKRDGNFIRKGCSAALDEARALRDESRKVIASLQAQYAEATGVKSLKIRHNNVLGYFVEVAAGQAAALTRAGAESGAPSFIHRQSLASAMRFTTAELGELEARIASAGREALALELAIFDDLAARIAEAEASIRAAAGALAELDVACALAELAVAEDYVRPKVDNSAAFEILGGRHPVVEPALRAAGGSFVGNDCDLGPSVEAARRAAPEDQDGWGPAPPGPSPRGGEERAAFNPGRIWLITGPNMAGKSTFLRQNALIAILAQAGCYVPAKAARIGIVDAVFSRVGAADDLARGRSTFMVEMVETAAILNQAGPRALVILDEIGRGTATFDGLSIAWAAIEHLHDTNGCRALFATHYHELTALASKLPRLHNATMRVKEWKGDVVFLHEIVPGAADRSYGIQVAKLAGLPPGVVKRAKQVLESLERSDRARPRAVVDDLPLFAVRAAEKPEEKPHPVLDALDAIDPDDLSPREALEALYALKRRMSGDT